MDINISCRNCISENWDEYLEFFVSIIVWAIAQVNVIEFIFIIFRNEKITLVNSQRQGIPLL